MLPADEPRITLSQAASKYPGNRGAGRLHPATLTRWILAGIKALDGRIVRLEAERLGCRWLTTSDALRRFAAALTNLPPAEETPAPRSTVARSKASAAAARELEKMGA